jgi:hypothetical protein
MACYERKEEKKKVKVRSSIIAQGILRNWIKRRNGKKQKY